MIKLFLIFLSINSCIISVKAQLSNIDDSIMSIKRKWTKGDNVVVAQDPALKSNHFQIIYKKLDSIAALLKQSYPNPTGTEAEWHASVRGKPYYIGGPSPYSFEAMFKYYYYNKAYKKLMVSDETRTWAYVFVNDLSWLINDAGLDIVLNEKNKKVWELSKEVGEWKGLTVFEQESFAPNTKAVVVTKNGQMPWQPVSQLQYLQALRLKKENEKNKNIASLDEEASKTKKMIENIKNSKSYSADIKEKMIATAQITFDKQIKSKEAAIKTAEDIFARDCKVIDEYIKINSSESLQQQAVINAYHDFFQQKKFEDPASKAARKLIYIDQAYFKKDLPSYVPQFFTMQWRWNDVTPALFFKKQLEENFPVEKLEAMLR